jgi:hypothetical protein
MIVEGSDFLHLGFPAFLVTEDRELAWAEKYVRRDPDLSWILGNYVEADNSNDNGHIFPLAELTAAQATLFHKPLNMLHHARYCVGTFVGAELTTPPAAAGASLEFNPSMTSMVPYVVSSGGTTYTISGTTNVTTNTPLIAGRNPILEALAVFWKHNFPEEAQVIQKAHAEGSLYFSMETVPDEIECAAEQCKKRVKYAGRQHDSYCCHMNDVGGRKKLYKPHFNAGALIFPPVRPGWRKAEINELSQLLHDHADMAEKVYAGLEHDLPHLEASQWESMMSMIMLQAKQFSTEKRQKLAKSGKAMPHGGFPIENAQDLRNAIQAFGRAKDKAAAKAHIIKRARALGLTKMLPKDWL